MNKSARVVIIFRRFGPYHVARLNAAARYFELHAIEYSASDDTYAWAPVQGSLNFKKYVVASHTPVGVLAKRTACARLHTILSGISPVTCALPGWSLTESLMGLQWCVKNRVPAILMTASSVMDHKRTWYKEWIKRQVVRQFSCAVVGGTPQAEYAEMLGIKKDRIFLGYDVVDNDYFASNADRVRKQAKEFGRLHSLPEKYFLASARFIQKKNLLCLLEAYADYLQWAKTSWKTGNPDTIDAKEPWHLVVIGDGPLRPVLEAKVDRLDIKNYVHFPGFKQYDELPIYYGLAQAFILASTSEQWGLVVNEAMASGLPVLVSQRCGCAKDLVKDGINGFTYDPFSINAIRDCMLKIATMRYENRIRMGMASKEIIREWSPERFAWALRQAIEHAKITNSIASLFSCALIKALVFMNERNEIKG